MHPPADLKPVLARLATGQTLSEAEAEAAFATIMDGAATPAQIGGLLMALRTRGETGAELAGAARALRARMRAVSLPPHAIDVCGTGGDQLGTLNVSTAVTFVVAGAGVPVAKHGNRSASSRSGGADVLAALGVRLDPPLARLPAILVEANCVFLFAPRHHAALRHAAAARAELGTRTLFNLLGPLANPAGVRRQLAGVFHPDWLLPMAEVLASLGSTHAWIVHGANPDGHGLDELSLAGDNHIAALADGQITRFTLSAASLGLSPAPIADILGGTPEHNAAALLDLLSAHPPATPRAVRRHAAYRDTVLLNAAAALVVAGRTPDLSAALHIARDSLASGAALAALDGLRAASERDS
jgi:anthranilate phosphoribosyltransferase/anthranilate synthase/phosphoribosyltransferase